MLMMFVLEGTFFGKAVNCPGEDPYISYFYNIRPVHELFLIKVSLALSGIRNHNIFLTNVKLKTIQ